MSEQYSDKTISALKERFAVTTINGRQAILDMLNEDVEVSYSILLSSAGQVEAKYHHVTWGDDYMSLLAELKGKLPQIIRAEYLPGKDAFVPIAGGYVNQFIKNRYHQPSIKPTAEIIDPSLFLEFMRRQFPIDVERELVIALMAMNIRKPERKIRFALLIRGEQGTGKGVLLDKIWQGLVGKNYFKGRCQQVVSKFNEYLSTHTTICLDEFYSSEKKNADNLKTKISDDTISVEPKGKEVKTVRNYCFFIATSNDECPVYIENGQDRRWFIPQFSKHKVSQAETQEFVSKQLIPWLDGEGLQAIRNYLETINLDDFNFNIAMDTQSKREISYSDPIEELKEELYYFLQDDCYHGVRLVALKEMFKGLSDWHIKSILKKCGYHAEENAKSYNGYKRCRWWVKPSNSECSEYLFYPTEYREVPLTYNYNKNKQSDVSDVSLDWDVYLSKGEQCTDVLNKGLTTVLEVCDE
jgi:hypothetical protein